MKKNILLFIVFFSILVFDTSAQTVSMSNKPSQTTWSKRMGTGKLVYGVFVGRIACQELMVDLNMAVNSACTKRKVAITLYHDAATNEPTTYETLGLGEWSGKGKWHIQRGTPADPGATVLQLELDEKTSLFLLKGDDNVLFILDRNKNFLIGNANFSYTLNRAAF